MQSRSQRKMGVLRWLVASEMLISKSETCLHKVGEYLMFTMCAKLDKISVRTQNILFKATMTICWSTPTSQAVLVSLNVFFQHEQGRIDFNTANPSLHPPRTERFPSGGDFAPLVKSIHPFPRQCTDTFHHQT